MSSCSSRRAERRGIVGDGIRRRGEFDKSGWFDGIFGIVEPFQGNASSVGAEWQADHGTEREAGWSIRGSVLAPICPGRLATSV
jgi:hypothetical protein